MTNKTKTGESCRSCNMPYETCTERILGGKTACCASCGYTDTHDERVVPSPASEPALPTVEGVLSEYATIARNIYDQQTAGDYTWLGFLSSFMGELDKARATPRD